ncbi:MAG: glycosyltransferase family 4 protein [Pseudomonadota bacterium]
MRIQIIDFSGHPFQVQLSRELARRGHVVRHVFTGSSETPKGDLIRRAEDPAGFEIGSVQLDERINKTNFVKRWSQERALGKLFAADVLGFRPELLICSNCPIETLARIAKAKRAVGARFLFWVQDLLGEAASRVLSARLGLPGAAVGAHYERVEGKLLREADHVVAISDDFIDILQNKYRIPRDKIDVIENWSPIADIPQFARNNEWATANLPETGFRVIYSGTLGFKQDPALLLEIASTLEGCRVEVFSEGAAAAKLQSDAQARGVDNLQVRPWIPFSDLPKALASADLLVVVLEPDAGLFSVPSKVLTYLCAGRPILGSINRSNLAAKIISSSGAGVTHEPGEHAALIASARDFMESPERRTAAGDAGRAYAEDKFNIDSVGDRFETAIHKIN